MADSCPEVSDAVEVREWEQRVNESGKKGKKGVITV